MVCTDVLPQPNLPLARSTLQTLLLSIAFMGSGASAWAAGTPAGTVIDNQVQVSFVIGGSATSIDTNTTSITVAERIDVSVTPLSPQTFVAPGELNSSLLFRVVNIGNGNETFRLNVNNAVVGDDFDPLPASPGIYFDSDASGTLSAGDEPYSPGTNDPLLPPDAFVDILLVNDIPAAVGDGQIGRSELTATSLTGNGSPGDAFPNQGDGGVDAMVGASGGLSADLADYVADDVQVSVVKSVVVRDPDGGNEPVSGATLTYTVAIEVTNSGTATNSVFADPIPTNTSFVASSISLNGGGLTDAPADDAGEYDATTSPTVVVRLGDLTQASGVQTVSFDVVID